MARPSRGDVWLADLNPVRGHEQAGRRPVLVVSDDGLNHSRAGVAFVVPLTTHDRRMPQHVRIDPPEGGIRDASFAMCEHLRSVSVDRLTVLWGSVSPLTLGRVEDRLRMLLSL